jgi:hypothetical protein
VQARVPELEGTAGTSRVPGGELPRVTRQRLQYSSSPDRDVPRRHKHDLWQVAPRGTCLLSGHSVRLSTFAMRQVNHLAGGPVESALEAAGFAARAKEFKRCRQASATRKQPCYNLTVVTDEVQLVPFGAALDDDAASLRAIDLLVLDVHGAAVDGLLRAFPLGRSRPTLIYYRHPSSGRQAAELRKYLVAHGYETSAHWEVSAWGEMNLAWRAARCGQPPLPGPPLWARLAAAPATTK